MTFIQKPRFFVTVLGLAILTFFLAGCAPKVQSGTITLPDGARYSGQYINNIPNGKGHLEAADGTVYDGDFKNGKFEGKGKLVQFNKWEYEGAFKDGVPNGKGSAKTPQGIKFYGIYKDGKLIKQLAKPTLSIKPEFTSKSGTTGETFKVK